MSKTEEALRIAMNNPDADKAWVVDQMVRALLTPRGYEVWVEWVERGEDGTVGAHPWKKGIAP